MTESPNTASHDSGRPAFHASTIPWSGASKAARENALVSPAGWPLTCSFSRPSGIQAFQSRLVVGSGTAAPHDCRMVMNPFTDPADAPVTMRGVAAIGLRRMVSTT